MIGDTLADVQAGRNSSCYGQIPVRTGYGKEVEANEFENKHFVGSIADAVDVVLLSGGE